MKFYGVKSVHKNMNNFTIETEFRHNAFMEFDHKYILAYKNPDSYRWVYCQKPHFGCIKSRLTLFSFLMPRERNDASIVFAINPFTCNTEVIIRCLLNIS